MTDQTLARAVGWLSVAAGASFLVLPTTVSRLLGMGDRSMLVRALGVRDVIIGVQAVRSANPVPWLQARAVSDAVDAMMMSAGAISRVFDRRRSALGVVGAVMSSALTLLLARRLNQD